MCVVFDLKKTIALRDWGSWIRKKGWRFVIGVGKDKEKREEFPASQVEMILIGGSSSISSSALQLAVEKRIPVFFTYPSGYPYAALFPMVSTGSARTRMEQYLSRLDDRGLKLAVAFAEGKLLNQYYLLRTFIRYRMKRNKDLAKYLNERADEIKKALRELRKIQAESLDFGLRSKLMNIEGRGAEAYWEAISQLIPSKFGPFRREKRGAKDVVNSLLNFGYGFLLARVTTSLFYVGLDPYAGYLHVDRAGRESLSLDLMEEFRQQAVDRVVLRLISTKQIGPDAVDEEGQIKNQPLSILLDALEERMHNYVYFSGRKMKLNTAIKMQARRIVQHILRTKSYSPFYLRY